MKHRLLKAGLFLLTIILMSVLVFQGLKWWRFERDAPVADYPTPATISEARAQDVEHLALFLELERSWDEDSLRTAQLFHSELAATASSMSDAEFDLAVATLVALANNAHTKVREYSRTPRYSRLPVRGYFFADGYHVIRAHRGFEHLLGARIDAIDGVPMARVLERIRPLIAGVEGTFLKYAPYLIESPELMHAAGIGATPTAMNLELVGADGTRMTVALAAPFPPSEQQIARSHVLLSPQVYATSQPEWQVLKPTVAPTPTYLRDPLGSFHYRQLSDQIAYLQFWTNSNARDASIQTFCEGALEQYRQQRTPALVVDHRFNGGGNKNLTRDCMIDLARSVPADGHLYVIVGGSTFSAGLYSVAYLKHHARGRVSLVGEPGGDTMVHFAEDNLLTLPNSAIEIKFSTGMHDLRGPCSDWSRCHISAWFNDLDLDDLQPDIPVPLTLNDFVAGRDPAMLAITADWERRADARATP